MLEASELTYLEFIQKIPQIIGLDLDSYKERQMERRIRQLSLIHISWWKTTEPGSIPR